MFTFKFRDGFDLKEGGIQSETKKPHIRKGSNIKNIARKQMIKDYAQNIKSSSQNDSAEEFVYERTKGAEFIATKSVAMTTSQTTQRMMNKALEKAKNTYEKGQFINNIKKNFQHKTSKILAVRNTISKRTMIIKHNVLQYAVIVITSMVLFVCLFATIAGGVSSTVDMAGGQDNITSAYLYLGTLEAQKGKLTGSGMSIKAEPIMAYMISEFGLQKSFDEKQKLLLIKIYMKINSSGLRNDTDEFFNKYNESVFSSKDKYMVYQKLMKEGIYSQFKTLGSPFVGKVWTSNISSAWGWRYHPISGGIKLHRGLDIGMPAGTPINSVCSGKVTSAGYNGGYGNCVMVRYQHEDTDITVLYAHLSSISVRKGMNIKEGAVVGRVGSTGNSTGPHLHIEVMDGAYSSDVTKLYYPRIYLKETKE